MLQGLTASRSGEIRRDRVSVRYQVFGSGQRVCEYFQKADHLRGGAGLARNVTRRSRTATDAARGVLPTGMPSPPASFGQPGAIQPFLASTSRASTIWRGENRRLRSFHA